MNHTKKFLQQLLLAAAVTLPLAASADEAAPMPPMGATGGQGMHGGPGMQGGPGMERGRGMMHGRFGHHHGRHGMMGMLRGLNLSEQQKDKIFSINYALIPAIRDQHKIVEKSHADLREMMKSGRYDDAKAAALIQASSQAKGRISLEKLRARQKVMEVLTPEQKQKLKERAQRWMHGQQQPHPQRQQQRQPQPQSQQ